MRFPARENRLGEELPETLDALVDKLAADIERDDAGLPTALFGHCTGALIAFEVARRASERNAYELIHLLISRQTAPHVPSRRPRIDELPFSELVDQLRAMGGTEEALLRNEALMRLLEPALRGDFKLLSTYAYAEAPPLAVPITVFVEAEEPSAAADPAASWRRHTTGEFRVQRVGPAPSAAAAWERLARVVSAEIADGAVARGISRTA